MEDIRFIKDDLSYEREESIKALISLLDQKTLSKEAFLAKRFMVSVIKASRKGMDVEKPRPRMVNRNTNVMPNLIPAFIPKNINETGIPIVAPEKEMKKINAALEAESLDAANIPRPPTIPDDTSEDKSYLLTPGREYGVIFSANQTLAKAVMEINNGKLRYKLIEPNVDARVMKKLEDMISGKLKNKPELVKDNNLMMKYVKKACDKFKVPFDAAYYESIKYYLYRDYIKFGKIDPLLMDENVSSLTCDGVNKPISIIFSKEQIDTNVMFNSSDEINTLLYRFAKLANVPLNATNNVLDVTIGNLRINATLGLQEISSRFIITKEKVF